MEVKDKTVIQGKFGTNSIRIYQDMSGCILFYDVTNLLSFTSLSKWIDEINTMADKNPVIMLIGNKCEASEEERVISTEKGKQFAKQHNFLFMEVSVAENINISELFDKLIEQTVEKLIKTDAL